MEENFLKDDNVQAAAEWLRANPPADQQAEYLKYALTNRAVNCALHFLDNGVNPNLILDKRVLVEGGWMQHPLTIAISTMGKGFPRDPFYPSAERPWSKVLHKLISLGCDINAIDPTQKTTPLTEAVDKASTIGLEVLLSQPNIDLNKKDGFGRTALHIAIQTGLLYTARALVEKGAKLSVKYEGKTPIELAAELATNPSSYYQIDQASMADFAKQLCCIKIQRGIALANQQRCKTR